MHALSLLLLALLVPGAAVAAGSPPAAPADPAPAAPAAMTEGEETLYAIGALLSRQLAPHHFNGQEADLIARGFSDQLHGRKLEVKGDLSEWGPKAEGLIAKRAALVADEEKLRGAAFVESAAQEPGAVKTASGIVIRTLKAGEGASPTATDRVTVHYVGSLIDGTVFDSSRKRGTPAEFKLTEVVPCWTEGVQRMHLGETARLVCPSALAYGPQGRPPKIPGNATLIFEIELLSMTK